MRFPFHLGRYGKLSEGKVDAWIEPATIVRRCGADLVRAPECATGACGGPKPDVTLAEKTITVWKDGKGPNPLKDVEITIE